MNKRPSYAAALASLNPLPTPRGAALHMIRMAERDDASVDEVVRVAHADPALCGRLIQAANRLRHDSWTATGALEVAVQRIGFKAARQIALGFSLVGEHRVGNCANFDYAGFWSDSLLRALAAQAIAALLRSGAPAEAFVLGLLLHVGRLALATSQPAEYAELLEDAAMRGEALRKKERERFGIDHGELGAALLEQWMLPAEAARALQGHFAPAGTRTPDPAELQRTVGLADALVNASRASPDSVPAWTQVVLEAANRAGIDPPALDTIAASVAREAADWASLLHLPVPRVTRIDYAAYPGEIGDPCERGDVSGIRILLVDDEEDEHLLLSLALEKCGYRVDTASCAGEAIESIVGHPPHIVITDWQMPGMTGPDLCRTLRKTPLGAQLYLMIRTGRVGEGDLIAGIHAGANDFVSKDSDQAVLLARVEAGAKAARRSGARAAELAAVTRRAAGLALLGLK